MAEQKPTWRVSPQLRANAKALRRSMTDAERRIWYHVRAHRFQNFSFRRQVPIGPYILDFVCHAAKLIVELDGGQHFEADHLAKDPRRDAYLASLGYRVVRFNNLDVLTNTTDVLEMIAAVLGDDMSRGE